MHKTLVFVAVLLAGCQSAPIRSYNTAQADHVRAVMEQCAALIQSLPITTDAERDWHYQQCLLLSDAVI